MPGVRGLYAKIFELAEVPDTASFQDLGGDSLNYVEMSIALESELGALPQNWDVLPVARLAEMEGAASPKPATMETGIFLRAFAITCVVGTHSGIAILGGGTFLLFFLIGYNLARFKAPALLEGKVLSSLVPYTKTLIIPYFILAVLFMAYRREFQLDTLLLYTNLSELRLTQIFPFWFVQVLVQCLALTGLLLLIPQVRAIAKREPWRFAFGLTAILVGIWAIFPAIWDTDHLRNLVPQRYIALLWLGWCCFAAQTTRQKLMALALGLTFAFIDSGVSRRSAWIALGVVATLYVPMIPVPRSLRSAIQYVSAATFTIFALNGILAWGISMVFERVFGQSWSPITFGLTFIGCLIGYEAIRRIELLKPVIPRLLRRSDSRKGKDFPGRIAGSAESPVP